MINTITRPEKIPLLTTSPTGSRPTAQNRLSRGDFSTLFNPGKQASRRPACWPRPPRLPPRRRSCNAAVPPALCHSLFLQHLSSQYTKTLRSFCLARSPDPSLSTAEKRRRHGRGEGEVQLEDPLSSGRQLRHSEEGESLQGVKATCSRHPYHLLRSQQRTGRCSPSTLPCGPPSPGSRPSLSGWGQSSPQ